MQSKFQKLALEMLSHLGIEYKFVTRPNKGPHERFESFPDYRKRVATRDYLWDGKTLRIYRNNSFSSTIHELAHWLVASPKDRKLPEFGLGNPNEVKIHAEVAPHLDKWQEENQASALGIAIEKHLGSPNWRKTVIDHNWNLGYLCNDEMSIEYFWRTLGRPGLYDSEGVPQIIHQVKDWLQTAGSRKKK